MFLESTGAPEIALSAPVGAKLQLLSGVLEHVYRPSILSANPRLATGRYRTGDGRVPLAAGCGSLSCCG